MDDFEEVKTDSDNDEEAGPSPYMENPSHLSVTAVLHYCKHKIVHPYLRLLSVTGLRSLTVEQIEPNICFDALNCLYSVHVILMILLGYVLQYMTCFRRDRGFCYKILTPNSTLYSFRSIEKEIVNANLHFKYDQICHGSLVFSYIIPSVLHLGAYLYAAYVFRSSESDRLPSLMERVFLSSSYITDGVVIQKKLIKLLWAFVVLDAIWMLLSLGTMNMMMFTGNINFRWLEKEPNWLIIFLQVMLIICTLYHDIIQATVISNYCLQTQLLTSYLQFLRAKLIQYPSNSVDWMREIVEFKTLLKYINDDLAPPVGIFTFINLCWFISGTFWLLGFDRIDKQTQPIYIISILNVILWATLTIAPFIQAARLTGACQLIRSVGHEVRARPFAHQGTPGHELDSILMYTSSLKMNATLFKIPITGRTLAIGITATSIIVLVIGQCHYLTY